eukprot:14481093-Alexandrium_andersonii.AAC.1
MGNRLWRCAPEQLRAASSREAAMFESEHPPSWTFHDGLRDLPVGEYVPADDDYDDQPAPEDVQHTPTTLNAPGGDTRQVEAAPSSSSSAPPATPAQQVAVAPVAPLPPPEP